MFRLLQQSTGSKCRRTDQPAHRAESSPASLPRLDMDPTVGELWIGKRQLTWTGGGEYGNGAPPKEVMLTIVEWIVNPARSCVPSELRHTVPLTGRAILKGSSANAEATSKPVTALHFPLAGRPKPEATIRTSGLFAFAVRVVELKQKSFACA